MARDSAPPKAKTKEETTKKMGHSRPRPITNGAPAPVQPRTAGYFKCTFVAPASITDDEEDEEDD